MERKIWEKVSRSTEMENSMTYVLKCTEKAIQHPPTRLANRYLVMGAFTVGTMFTQPLAGNGRLRRLHFPVSLDELWTNYSA
jgi:hypothetical protein